MEDLSLYFKRFSDDGIKILKSSLAESQRRNQHIISPEHILFALMREESEIFDIIMLKHSIDPNQVRNSVEKRLKNSPRHAGAGFCISPSTLR